MPYKIEKQGDKYCVVKETDGKVMGCHPTEAEARDQQKALYANEDKLTKALVNLRETIDQVRSTL